MQKINKFYLQAGLGSGDLNLMHDPKSMEQIQSEIIERFDCSPDWPLCLFDFTYKNKIPQYFSFRVAADLTSFCHDGYIYGMTDPQIKALPKHAPQDKLDEVLIERNQHICTSCNNFIPAFKRMFHM